MWVWDNAVANGRAGKCGMERRRRGGGQGPVGREWELLVGRMSGPWKFLGGVFGLDIVSLDGSGMALQDCLEPGSLEQWTELGKMGSVVR